MVEIRRACLIAGNGVGPCSDGGLAVPGSSRCRNHGGKAWSGVPKARQAAYNDPVYIANRKRLLAGSPLCSVPGCRLAADTVDHIRAVSAGGDNSLENLRPMCRRHNHQLGSQLGGTVTKLRRRKR